MEITQVQIHSYYRLCGDCYRDACERASERTGKAIGELWIERWTASRVLVHLEFTSSVDILPENIKAEEEGPFGVNENQRDKVVACMFEGAIDREKALRRLGRKFHNRPRHFGPRRAC